MTSRLAIVVVLLGLFLAWIPACGGAPIEGAWEAKVDYPKGSDPSGFEVHLTVTRFLKGEPGGAVEYTIFHPTQKTETCKGSLEGVSKAGGIFEYEETITQGGCVSDMVVRISDTGAGLKWERLTADGGVDKTAVLSVQTGIPTAKDRPGG
jgi:hypothetical protein